MTPSSIHKLKHASYLKESQKSGPLVLNHKKRLLTFLTVALCPAAFTEVSIDGCCLAGGLSDGRPWADIATFSVVFVGYYVVVLHRVQDLGPVQGREIAKIWVLLNPHSSSGDVHQAMEADLSQLEHLEHHQSVVEEQVTASDDCQVGEETAEALHAVNSEEQQVVSDHSQLGESDALEILWFGPEHE